MVTQHPHLHADQHHSLIQRLAGLEHDGHALPARVAHVQLEGGKGGRAAVLRHGGVVLVPGLPASRRVLAKHAVLQPQRRHAPQDLPT